LLEAKIPGPFWDFAMTAAPVLEFAQTATPVLEFAKTAIPLFEFAPTAVPVVDCAPNALPPLSLTAETPAWVFDVLIPRTPLPPALVPFTPKPFRGVSLSVPITLGILHSFLG
jgi:hypothetical protein